MRVFDSPADLLYVESRAVVLYSAGGWTAETQSPEAGYVGKEGVWTK
jgi:hypothetical protein